MTGLAGQFWLLESALIFFWFNNAVTWIAIYFNFDNYLQTGMDLIL